MAAQHDDRFGACLRRGPLAMTLVLGACVTVPPSGGSPSAVAMQHIPLAIGQASTGGAVLSHPLPAYPPTLLAARLPPQEIQARLMVDEQGKVAEVRIDGMPQADAQRRLFAAAVREAALQWTFMPLRASRWAADAAGNAHDVDSGPQPFSVDVLFRFSWRDSRPLVEAQPLAHDGVPALGHSDD